ncbi:MAG: shikimate kinase [Lachnospiraceae bacterium]|nr:shikimate kinase [Lachnospiraceae bacterium]
MGKIVLEGFMGSGKSTYGKALARKLGWSFIDTDALIEDREGRAIPKIFEEDGEDYFRRLETDTIGELSGNEKSDAVISVGGGLPVREKNRDLMKKCGTVVYLKGSEELLYSRLISESESRPMLHGGELRDRIRSLLNEREELYLDASDAVVLIDGKEPDEVLDEIVAIAGV